MEIKETVDPNYVSSEEALKFFDNLKHNYTIDFDDIEKCCNKAISDMQKLDKIKEIIYAWRTGGFLLTYETIQNIERII